MGDIVEMLVDAAGGNEAHVCAIAAAEIERNQSQIEQLDARCGRLRDTCSTWERASNNYAEAVEIKDAEIERLRANERGWLAANGPGGWIDDLRQEIERLRVELANVTSKPFAYCTEPRSEILRRQQEEIERLRGLLADVQIILDSHNNIVGNLNGEITRLRGLLRELYAATDEFWIADELLRRIREALGDAPDHRD